MNKLPGQLFLLLAVILLSRLVLMLIFPLTDTTEARYAEVARLMLETGDWITPYFDYNIPFWGKPPLSFWLEALSFKLFGLHDFAPRFPSWIASLLTLWLIYHVLSRVADQRTGLWAGLIFSSFALVYMLSGVVITDPFLALATSLSLLSFVMVLKHKPAYWGYLFFVGISLGLLSKGPIALVLIGGTISLWLLFSPKRWRLLKLLPWVGGISLMAVLTLPWYIAAEMKTPGFLEYFILGEHFYRFVIPDWKGDLYGSAHDKPKGTIWLLWFQASFPWGILALLFAVKAVFKQPLRSKIRQLLSKDDISLYLVWALFPMVFFTLSGNILWTYILPGLPPLAILLALYLAGSQNNLSEKYSRLWYLVALIVPVSITVFTFYVYQDDDRIRTEKHLVEFYDSVATPQEPLVFIDERSFSARYYSRGRAQLIPWSEFKQQVQLEERSGKKGAGYYVAVPEDLLGKARQANRLPAEALYRNNRYELYKIEL